MKKLLIFLMLAALLLTSCSENRSNTDFASEEVSADYGLVIELAKKEFNTVFKDYGDLEITEISTMVRTNDNDHIVIQFSYTSENGFGTYGIEYRKDSYGNFELIQQGEDITVDSLLN